MSDKWNYPNLFTLHALWNTVESTSTEIDGVWVPSRPLGFASFRSRVRCAWLVFTGKADAVVWPGGQ